jgi:FkbM family methyltransferase
MSNKQQATSKIADAFNYWIDFNEHRINKLRYSLLKRLSKKSLPLFFKGGDIISLDPISNGSYEVEIKALIEHFADNGYDNFLLDIGANIGLTSCQSGSHFQEVHLFEPNPNCVNILKINTNIALRNTKYVIHNYGLGIENERLDLYVPYDNWGGAFIKSNENEYDEQLLSNKDGYGRFNINNYDILEVQIKSAEKVLIELYENLEANGKTKGVIKVDAEGYEKFILNAIIASKPKLIDCVVIFENWKDNVSINDYFNEPTNSFELYKLESKKLKLSIAPRWVNSLLNFIRGGYPVKLKKINDSISAGTYLLIFSK